MEWPREFWGEHGRALACPRTDPNSYCRPNSQKGSYAERVRPHGPQVNGGDAWPPLKAFVRALLLSLVLTAAPLAQQAQAQQGAPMIRILLKSDADEIFRTTREEWVTKVDVMVTAGAAKARGTPEADLTMVLGTDVGALLTILPAYRKREDRPEFIEISIGYRNPKAALLTGPLLEDAIQVGKEQLRPEYAVTGRYERDDDGITVFFVIMQEG